MKIKRKFKFNFKHILFFVLPAVILISGIIIAVSVFGGREKENGGEGTQQSATECSHLSTFVENKKAATCISKGYSGDEKCSDCGAMIKEGEVLDITDHSWGEEIVTKYPTCLSTGSKTVKCSVCNAIENVVVEALPCNEEYHFEANEAHRSVCDYCYKNESSMHEKSAIVAQAEASCEESAYILYHCDACDCDFKEYDASKPAIGHSWNMDDPIVIPATCSSEGMQYFVCENEGCEKRSEIIYFDVSPLSHSFELSSRVDPTCASEGMEEYTCSGCGVKRNVVLPILDHTFSSEEKSGNWVYGACQSGCLISEYIASDVNEASILTEGIRDNTSFVIRLNGIKMEFPWSAARDLKDYYSVLVTVEPRSLSISTKTTGADISAMYDIKIVADGAPLSAFADKVKVTLSYALGEGEYGEGIAVGFIYPDGSFEAIESSAFYDEDGDGRGELCFEIDHFSNCAVKYAEAYYYGCIGGEHDYRDSALWIEVEASCAHLGYTLKKCCVCGASSVDGVTEMMKHKLSEKSEPTVDCENGGYVQQMCQNCPYVINYEYIPALGHSLKNIASCAVSGVCKSCEKIIVPSYCHEWSDWTVTRAATEEEKGIKTRFCPVCGGSEDAEIPALSDIPAAKMESYSDFFEFLIAEAINSDNCQADVLLSFAEKEYRYRVTVNANGENCLARIIAEVKNAGETEEFSIYYKNGVAVVIEDGSATVLSVDEYGKLFPNFEEMYEYLQSVMEDHSLGIIDTLDSFQRILDRYIEQYGEHADEMLMQLGCNRTAEELQNALKLVRRFYAYFSCRFGVSAPTLTEDEAPTRKDIHLLFEFLAEKSANGELTEYKLDFSNIKSYFEDIVKLLEDECENKLSDALYNVLGEIIKIHYPEIDGYEKLFDHIKQKYGGSVKVKTLINDIISIAEESEAYTAEEIYGMLDSLINAATGQNIRTEEWAKKYADKTLSQTVKDHFGEDMTMSAFYSDIDTYMRETDLGDWVLYEEFDGKEITFADKIKYARSELDKIILDGSLNCSIEEDGNIRDLDMTLSVSEGAISVTFGQSTEIITVAESVEGYFEMNAGFEYDANGNLIIKGLPEGTEIEVALDGEIDIPMCDLLAHDLEMSHKFNFDVFSLDGTLVDSEPIYYAEYDGYYFRISYYDENTDHPVFRSPFVDLSVDGMDKHTLPDGREVYSAWTEGNIENHGTVYGYIRAGEKLYARIICEYRGGSLYSFSYVDINREDLRASRYLRVKACDVIDIEEYISLADDGSVMISADALKIIRKGCLSDNSSVNVNVIARNSAENVDVALSHTVVFKADFEAIDSPDGSDILNADGFFCEESSDPVLVSKNADGSIGIVLIDGGSILLNCEFDMSAIDIKDALEYSYAESLRLGFEAYRATTALNINSNGLYETKSDIYTLICGRYVKVSEMIWVNAKAAYSLFGVGESIYGVCTSEGWRYYRDWTFGDDGMMPIDEIETGDGDRLFKQHYVGSIADGGEIYSFKLYSSDIFEIREFKETKLLVSSASSERAYAVIGENTFVSGRLIGEEFIPDNCTDASIGSESLAYALNLHRYINVCGAYATISPEAVPIFEKYKRYFALRILSVADTTETIAEMSYEDICNWFND